MRKDPPASVTLWFGFQMPCSECLLGDRKLSATDQGLSDNGLSAPTAHTDLELMK